MGDSEGEPDEQPLSRVAIARPFWMAACEISNEQFRQFNSTHDSRYYQKRYPALEPGAPGWVGPDARGVTLNGDRQPVVRVSWDEAMAFCRWLSARTSLRFNLPARARSAFRLAYPSWQRVFNVGFRVMCENEVEPARPPQ
jgi:formylglycine-generating enzyme required for sulfatase activity